MPKEHVALSPHKVFFEFLWRNDIFTSNLARSPSSPILCEYWMCKKIIQLFASFIFTL